MRRFILAAVCAAASLTAAAPAAATTTDACRDASLPRPYACTARTAERKPVFAIAQMGTWSHGWTTLTCTRGQSVQTTRFFMAAGRRTTRIALSGKSDCVLTIRPRSNLIGRFASARVTLVT